METKLKNNYAFAIVQALSYAIDPAAAVVPIEECRVVVLSGESTPTNKALARYPEAGDAADILLGVTNAGGESALRGDFPDASQTHISVVESGRYIIEVADGETILLGQALYGVDAEGKLTAAGNGIFDTGALKPIEGSTTSTAASPSYIRVNIHK